MLRSGSLFYWNWNGRDPLVRLVCPAARKAGQEMEANTVILRGFFLDYSTKLEDTIDSF